MVDGANIEDDPYRNERHRPMFIFISRKDAFMWTLCSILTSTDKCALFDRTKM